MLRFRTAMIAGMALVALTVSGRSEADPIVITGGSVGMVNGIDLPGFTVTGSNSSFTGILTIAGVLCCVFNPGDVVPLDFTFPVGSLAHQPSAQTVDGTDFPAAFLTGNFRLSGEPLVAPPIGGTSFALTTSFSMAGLISGFSDFPASGQLFSVPITGTGTATVSGRIQGGTYIGSSVSYQFQEAAPTPEPATMLLVGTAMLGLGLGARRRKRSAKPPSF